MTRLYCVFILLLNYICNFSFSTVFSTHLENILSLSTNLKLSSASSFTLKESNICRLGKGKAFTPQILILNHQQQTAFGNIVGKGEIARSKQFLLFPGFLLDQIMVSPFCPYFRLHIFFCC